VAQFFGGGHGVYYSSAHIYVEKGFLEGVVVNFGTTSGHINYINYHINYNYRMHIVNR